MPRYFTHAEAQSLLPRVEKLLQDTLLHFAEHQRNRDEYDGRLKRILLAGGMAVQQAEMAELKSKAASSAQELTANVQEIQEMGVQIKDLQIGLVDFPTLYKGEEVLLCWKLGEDRIECWHSLSEGFRGRRPVDDEFLANHQGS